MDNHFIVNTIRHGDGSENFDLVQFEGGQRLTLHTTCETEEHAQTIADILNERLVGLVVDNMPGGTPSEKDRIASDLTRRADNLSEQAKAYRERGGNAYFRARIRAEAFADCAVIAKELP